MTELVPATASAPDRRERVPDDVSAAAHRFARLMLRQSPRRCAPISSPTRASTLFLRARVREDARLAAAAAGVDLAEHELPSTAPLAAFTADAVASYFDARESQVSAATVKKERAALNRLAKYLHTVGAIDATEILIVPAVTETSAEVRDRDALDEPTWMRVKAAARQRLTPPPRGRASISAARRDLAMVLLLGEMGLRSEEVRSLPRHGSIDVARADGSRPWLTVMGKGRKQRRLPIPLEVEQALSAWIAVRDQLYEPGEKGEPLMFPRLGRPTGDGAFPYIGKSRPGDRQLSHAALIDVVRPLMTAAGVPTEQAIPHALRHTYGTLYMRRPGARLEDLRALMGHASISTTLVYHHDREADIEAAVAANQAHAGDVLGPQRRAARRSACAPSNPRLTKGPPSGFGTIERQRRLHAPPRKPGLISFPGAFGRTDSRCMQDSRFLRARTRRIWHTRLYRSRCSSSCNGKGLGR